MFEAPNLSDFGLSFSCFLLDCGEYYLDETTTDRILTQAEDAVRKGAELEILRFAA